MYVQYVVHMKLDTVMDWHAQGVPRLHSDDSWS